MNSVQVVFSKLYECTTCWENRSHTVASLPVNKHLPERLPGRPALQQASEPQVWRVPALGSCLLSSVLVPTSGVAWPPSFLNRHLPGSQPHVELCTKMPHARPVDLLWRATRDAPAVRWVSGGPGAVPISILKHRFCGKNTGQDPNWGVGELCCSIKILEETGFNVKFKLDSHTFLFFVLCFSAR